MNSPLVLSAAAGLFPGADSVDALWQRVLSAEPAPTTVMAADWGLEPARYRGVPGQADAICQDHAHCLSPAWRAAPDPALDRQAWLGQQVLAQLKRAAGPLPARTGLLLATSWTGESFYRHEAALRLGYTPPSQRPLDPAAQLAAIAGELRGPRLAMDTACASSLYALIEAAGLIRRGAAQACVVMGLNAYLPPFLFAGFTRLGALSVRGALRPYLAGADGIVLGEAVAAVLLETEASARAAGRPVLAYLWAQGRSADGADRSIFAPGARGLAQVLQRSWAELPGELRPACIEGHGTGTPTGDATELQALAARFGDAPLALGSVKGLVGHTLAAAGLVSLVKTAYALREGVIPPHVAGEPHPSLAGTSLYLPARAQAWPESPAGRIGAVSALGFGGANAHVVLADQPPPARRVQVPGAAPPALAIIDAALRVGAAQGRAALDEQCARLPAQLTIDAQGLRLGPAMLARVEPFQVLTSALAAELAARHPQLERESAQAVFLTNMGGAMSLRSAARVQHLWQQGSEGSDAVGPAITPESIASSLPSLCSGYAAFHLDWQGAHQTVSGAPGSFWELLAGQLEADDPTLLGAGCHRYAEQQPQDTPELAGWLLLERAPADRPVLGRVLGHARHAAGAEHEFWKGLGLAPREDDATLDLAADPAAGTEAAGLVPLLRALESASQRLYVRAPLPDGQVLSLLLERGTRRWAEPAPALRPLALHMRGAPAPAAASGAVAPAEPARHEHAAPAPAAPGLFDADAAADSLAGPGEAAGSAATRIRAYLAETTPVMERYFVLQQRALALTAAAPARPELQRAPQHQALEQVRVDAEGIAAALRVDESHPYFFDHPLDHVPGILLLEGMLQAVELWLSAQGGQGVPHVSALSLRFSRYCEKRPAQLTLRPQASGELLVEIRQDGRRLCHARCRAERAPAPAAADAEPPRQALRPPRELLHKQREDNVLVGVLQSEGPAHTCALLTPPPGHLLADGDPTAWTPLYWLETARQFFMLLAHGPAGVPLGLPMNLVSLELELPRPVPRGLPLRLRTTAPAQGFGGGTELERLQCELHGPAGKLGELRVQAMVVDPTEYEQQRGGPS